ncbi:hypothetical protein [Bacillus toyonensis]|uniref:hypothetical protein n=1 Tax=Bacillus toyonensis TaxID=155322 RepID=UPI000BF3071A|nr:hypothetical protein [Bacillus toyonensis]PGD13316.1 hypothetical protein COM35_22310 [Bacillus toyonensis]
MKKETTCTPQNDQKKTEIREFQPNQGSLILKSMNISNNTINFQFSWGSAIWNFNSLDTTTFTTSNPNQALQSAPIQVPSSINDVPDSESNAVLMTDPAASSTWATQTHHVHLNLGGFITFKWEVMFEFPMLPFRLDGIWTRL